MFADSLIDLWWMGIVRSAIRWSKWLLVEDGGWFWLLMLGGSLAVKIACSIFINPFNVTNLELIKTPVPVSVSAELFPA